MSVVSVPPAINASTAPAPNLQRRWIVNSWTDTLFIILTPLIATPAVMILYSSWVGVNAETISLVVATFFATGHHLPGLIRAYGDRELFERFKWRFVVVPPLVFLAYFPLYTYHFDLYRLIIISWASWHGLMQLYGFARIYDAKVGSISRSTAYWDWLLCLCGIVTPQLLRPDYVSMTLGYWYSAGGPWVPAEVLTGIRWASLAVSIGVLIGFTIHVVAQSYRGTRPSSLKLLMLGSGIGLWWFVMLGVDNLLLSIALFDICHDVQYLAIVWLFNCRRVTSNAPLGRFMKYVFRRGMVLLYLGLITAYGAIAFAGNMVLDGTISRIFYGVLFTSTILHYYFDGFIWKVREASNQAGLGLTQNSTSPQVRQMKGQDFSHLLKWSPIIVGLGLIFAGDIFEPSLSTSRKNELDRLYAKSLMGASALPQNDEERSWLYSQFEQAQRIASTVPDDQNAQLRATIMLANFGRPQEAIDLLEKLLNKHPNFADAQLTLGAIHLNCGNPEKAIRLFETALANSRTEREKSIAHLKLGEAYLRQDDKSSADETFAAALRMNPKLQPAIEAMRNDLTSSPGRKPELTP